MDKQTLLKILHEDAVHAAARALKTPKVKDLWNSHRNHSDFEQGFMEAKRQLLTMKYEEFEKQLIFNETLQKVIE